MNQLNNETPGSEFMTQTNDVNSDKAEDTSEALSLRITRFLQLCWVRRRMFFGILVTGSLLSLLYALYPPNVYTSTTTLMPPDSISSSSNLLSLLSSVSPAASAGSSFFGVRTPSAVFVSILKSRTVLERLVTRFDLVHYYKSSLLEIACKRLADDTQVSEDIKSGIITIKVNADNPTLASKLAQGYVEELDHIVTNNSTSAARRERIFLEERLKEIKQDLDDSAKALSQFSTKNRTIDIPSQGRAMVESGLKLQDQMAIARSDLAGLQQTYSDDNVRIRAAHARIAELQRQIDKVIGSSKDSKLDANDSAYPSVSELPTLGITYFDLERKLSVEEVLWVALTKQYEAARVQEEKEIPTVRVLDVANVPQRKSAPRRSTIVIVGAFLSLIVAFIAVLLTSVWERMDAQDERKKLVLTLVEALRNIQQRFWSLPGMGWIHTRFKGSESGIRNSL